MYAGAGVTVSEFGADYEINIQTQLDTTVGLSFVYVQFSLKVTFHITAS